MATDIREQAQDLYKEGGQPLQQALNETDPRTRAQALYEQGNRHRKHQQWDLALNAYEQAATLDPASPAVHARQMLQQIMDFRCKEYYNP